MIYIFKITFKIMNFLCFRSSLTRNRRRDGSSKKDPTGVEKSTGAGAGPGLTILSNTGDGAGPGFNFFFNTGPVRGRPNLTGAGGRGLTGVRNIFIIEDRALIRGLYG